MNLEGESYYEEEEEVRLFSSKIQESSYENESTIISNNSKLVGLKPKIAKNTNIPSKSKLKEEIKGQPESEYEEEEEESEYETETINDSLSNNFFGGPSQQFHAANREDVKKKKQEEIRKKKEDLK